MDALYDGKGGFRLKIQAQDNNNQLDARARIIGPTTCTRTDAGIAGHADVNDVTPDPGIQFPSSKFDQVASASRHRQRRQGHRGFQQ